MNKDGLFVKVCGMTSIPDVNRLNGNNVRYVGFIFYEPSPRNAFAIPVREFYDIESRLTPVGVFVDSDLQTIVDITRSRRINTVQLHGDEDAGFCARLKEMGYTVIKAFRIKNISPVALEHVIRHYTYPGVADYLLFDAGGSKAGGNGMHFNWEVLRQMRHTIPFILSGGLAPGDVDSIENLHNDISWGLFGIDINSKFETAPGIKDIKLINEFTQKLL